MRLELLYLFCVLLVGVPAMADPGNGIVADSKGNIFYSDLSQVWKIDKDGHKTIAVPGVHTHELYIDKNDNLFGEHLWYNGEAANTWGHYAWRLDAHNRLEKVIKDTAGFLEWYSFVRDDAGNMYYAEKSIPTSFWKISPGGQRTLLGSISLRDVGRMLIHKGVLFFYNHDDIYTIRQGDSIQLFRSNLYDPQKAVKPGEKCERCIESLWGDGDDNIYVAVSGNGIIKKIDKNGNITVVHQSADGWFPTGGVVAPDKTLWVLEYNMQNQVRAIRATARLKLDRSSLNITLIAAGVFATIFIIALFIKGRKKKTG